MSSPTIPPLRDLPAAQVTRRRQHLLAETARAPRPRHGLADLPTARTLVLAAAALALIAGPTLAFSATARELLGLSRPHPILARAQLQISAPAPHDQVLRLYTAPSSEGGECWFITVEPANARPRPNTRGGGGCTTAGGTLHSSKLPFQIGYSQTRKPDGPGIRRWIPAYVNGWISRTLHATRVELQWRHGRKRLPLRNNYFLAATPILYSPPFADLPFALVAYDAHGRQVARQKLDNASLYLDWKQHHIQQKLRAYWKTHGRP